MRNDRSSAKIILLMVLVCAICDFVRGHIHGRSFLAGVIGVICGLFSAAWILFLSVPWKDTDL